MALTRRLASFAMNVRSVCSSSGNVASGAMTDRSLDRPGPGRESWYSSARSQVRYNRGSLPSDLASSTSSRQCATASAMAPGAALAVAATMSTPVFADRRTTMSSTSPAASQGTRIVPPCLFNAVKGRDPALCAVSAVSAAASALLSTSPTK
ncbi:hypothetical protein BJF84_20000 [Rhodococcus sp. CUA-806]|nr:hypothetical protein BJF84_20000 [Rhodococcus sp. CUA-806]